MTARGAFLQAVSAVAGAFFGVRRSVDLDRDVQRLSPLQVVLAGIVGAALFVLAIVLLVKWVVDSGVGA